MEPVNGSKLLVFDKDGNVLTLRRSGTHPFVPFTQDLPGGKIELNESPLMAACRETAEETSIILRPEQLMAVDSRSFEAYGKTYNLHLFQTRIDSARPEVTVSWEHDQYEWIELDKLTGLDEGFQIMVNRFRERI